MSPAAQPPSRGPDVDGPHAQTSEPAPARTVAGEPHGDSLSGILEHAVERRTLARSSLASTALEIPRRPPPDESLLQRAPGDETEAGYLKNVRFRIKLGGAGGENAQLELERYVRERQRGASHQFAAHVAMFRNALFGQPSAVDTRSWSQIQSEGVWQLPPE